jgi:predicted peptidase
MRTAVIAVGIGILCLLAAFLLRRRRSGGPERLKTPIPPPVMIEERHSQWVRLPWGKKVESGYFVYLPTAYPKSEQTWPLVLVLHGSGESGTDLDKLAMQGLCKRAHEADLPFILLAPQCPKEDDWTHRSQQRRLAELVESVAAQYRVDPDRVYATGYSMGGYAVWDLATAHPQRFAAIAPICGRGNPSQADVIRHLPTWVFHGERDEAISVEASRDIVKALRKQDAPVKYTEYAGAGHDVWTRTYANPEFVTWLLAQKRGWE